MTEGFLTSSLWMPRIRSLAASQFTFLPVMTIISELLFSVGKSILVLVSSRICRHQQPFKRAAAGDGTGGGREESAPF